MAQFLPSGNQLLPFDVLSVAAYPPPTLFHRVRSVHWERSYYRDVARRADQLVVMMYDTALRLQKFYRWLMTQWTREVLLWSAPKEVLLGLPAYDDAHTAYHRPRVENLQNALWGIHGGLLSFPRLPSHYQGIALYSGWEMEPHEWALWRRQFLRQ